VLFWEEDGEANWGKTATGGGTLTGVLDRMQEGAIRRERDAHDRRIWRIWLMKKVSNWKRFYP